MKIIKKFESFTEEVQSQSQPDPKKEKKKIKKEPVSLQNWAVY
jgi:hypothetical protein